MESNNYVDVGINDAKDPMTRFGKCSFVDVFLINNKYK